MHKHKTIDNLDYSPSKHNIYLLQQLNGWLKVETEVNKLPLDTLSLVFFLFQNEHSVIEELLKLLIGVVDTQLLE